MGKSIGILIAVLALLLFVFVLGYNMAPDPDAACEALVSTLAVGRG